MKGEARDIWAEPGEVDGPRGVWAEPGEMRVEFGGLGQKVEEAEQLGEVWTFGEIVLSSSEAAGLT